MALPLVLGIASLLTSVGGQALSFTASAKKARQQEEAYKKYKRENTKAVTEDLYNQIALAKLRYGQQEQAQAFQDQQLYLQILEAERTAENSASESGVSGNSIDSLLRGYERTSAINDFVSARNLKMQGYQLSQELKAMKAKAQSAINLGQPFDYSSIVKPQVGAYLLSGINSGIEGFSAGYKIGNTFGRSKKEKL